MKQLVISVLALALLVMPVSAQQTPDAKAVVAAAMKAGGYENLNTIEYLGSGSEGNGMGQMQSGDNPANQQQPKKKKKKFGIGDVLGSVPLP